MGYLCLFFSHHETHVSLSETVEHESVDAYGSFETVVYGSGWYLSKKMGTGIKVGFSVCDGSMFFPHTHVIKRQHMQWYSIRLGSTFVFFIFLFLRLLSRALSTLSWVYDGSVWNRRRNSFLYNVRDTRTNLSRPLLHPLFQSSKHARISRSHSARWNSRDITSTRLARSASNCFISGSWGIWYRSLSAAFRKQWQWPRAHSHWPPAIILGLFLVVVARFLFFALSSKFTASLCARLL